jgi:hypothetical protein
MDRRTPTLPWRTSMFGRRIVLYTVSLLSRESLDLLILFKPNYLFKNHVALGMGGKQKLKMKKMPMKKLMKKSNFNCLSSYCLSVENSQYIQDQRVPCTP